MYLWHGFLICPLGGKLAHCMLFYWSPTVESLYESVHMGAAFCSFPKQILEMTDKHPPAECWEMGTLCCCHGRCRIERGGESGGREKGGKEMLHFFSQLFPFAFISPSLPPPTSSSSPFLPLPCRLNALLWLWFWPHLSSGDWPPHFL